ncbi:MAG: 3'-5' exonuclease [Proteobacteria bacterium]|nr:3'-5' exonuclease [Pseudomonadota bacterium]
MNIFVFDIETVPDVATGRKILGLQALSDEMVAQAMLSQAKEATGQAFVKHHLQKIVAISAVFRTKETFKVWSLGENHSSEAELIQRFFAGIEKYCPTLVSWNGCGFDLPVLHYRALYHGIPALTYWDSGERDSNFKWNNYLNRYHQRHIDLMDTLAAFSQKAYAKLDDIAVLLGLPGKMVMSGQQVQEYYFNEQLTEIRNYCEIDVLNTYLIYLRFQLIKGALTLEEYNFEIQLVADSLKSSMIPHLMEFLEAWRHNSAKIGSF